MNKYIIHIPHSSLYLPECFLSKVIIDEEEIKKENIFLCDELVDTFIPSEFSNVVKFPYSRMFIDVERFRSDKQETMSKLGMGAVYTKDSNGRIFISYDNFYRERILKKYYDIHHKLLEEKTGYLLDLYNTCQIIDLHSFSDELVYKLFGKINNPDICIGIEEEFNNEYLSEYTINFFESKGYTTMINYPYSGSLVPTKYYFDKDERVKSIMLEINKRVYLYDEEKYKEFKEVMNDYFDNVLKLKK